MITSFFAPIGTGKSLLLNYLVYLTATTGKCKFKNINFLRDCENVKYIYTNFPTDYSYKLDFDLLGVSDFSDSVIFIDEIQMLADCRDFKGFPKRLKDFFSLCRHERIDIIYCTQCYGDVDLKIRSKTEQVFFLKRGIFNTTKIIPIIIKLDKKTLTNTFDIVEKLTTPRIYRPKYYKYNDTHYMFDKDLKPRHLEKWVGSVPCETNSKKFKLFKSKKKIPLDVIIDK